MGEIRLMGEICLDEFKHFALICCQRPDSLRTWLLLLDLEQALEPMVQANYYQKRENFGKYHAEKENITESWLGPVKKNANF